MAWTTPRDWTDGELVSETEMNAHVRDNLNALKAPPTDNYECDEASDYSVSSTSMTDVDGGGTELTLTITTTGGDVLISFHGVVGAGGSPTGVYFDVYHNEDAAVIAGDDGITGFYTATSSDKIPVSFTRLLTSVSAGSHTFRLQWKRLSNNPTLYAGAGTSNYDFHPQFWVREAS